MTLLEKMQARYLEIIRADLAKYAQNNNLEKLSVSNRRGLTLETLQSLNYAYDAEWLNPKNLTEYEFSKDNAELPAPFKFRDKLPIPSRRIIIPTSDGNHYNAVLVKSDRTEKNKKWAKIHAGEKFPFNLDSLSTDKINILVEGENDAASIWQATGGKVPVIATAGAGVGDSFLKPFLEKVKSLDGIPQILILLDSDETGKADAPKFQQKLFAEGIVAAYDFLFPDEINKTDFNDILIAEGNKKLAEIIQNFLDAAPAKLQQAAVEMEKFNQTAQNKKEKLEKNKSARQDKKYDDPLEYTQDLAVYCFDFIDAKNFVRNDWLACVTALKNVGIDIETARALSLGGKGYSDAEFDAAWNSNLKLENFPVTTLTGKAKAAGADLSDFKYQWYKEHPQFQSKELLKKDLWFLPTGDGNGEDGGENVQEKFWQLYKSAETFTRNKQMINILRRHLEMNLNSEGQPTTPKKSFNNFHRIFTFDPNIAGLFGYNEFSNKITFGEKGQCLWRRGNVAFEEIEDSDEANLRLYIRQNYRDLHDDKLTTDFVTVFAKRNSYHPVRRYFEKLPAWDGTERAEKLFIDFLKVKDTEFTRAVTLKWLLAAVARVHYPACNFQAALVLQGNQNIGKSYILEKLGGAWYTALIDSIDDIRAVDALRNSWICEFKEFSAARKAEINAVKSFIERPSDNYRAAYARYAKNFKRQCIFAISVNDKKFLRDQTGNRRYWILESPLEKFCYIEGLNTEYIQQVWAEVYHKFKELTVDGFNDKILELPRDLKNYGEDIAQGFTTDDGLVSEISAWLDVPILPPILWNVLTIQERRKFYAEKKITLADVDWTKRGIDLDETETEEYEKALETGKYVVRFEQQISKNLSTMFVTVYGSYFKNETCAAEIYNEFCAGGDKRKNIFRIVDALGNVEGWKLQEGKRDKNFHGYGDQKNIYCRIEPIIPKTDIADKDDVDVPF